MFKNVIVKKPGKSYVQGLTTSNLGKPDYTIALKQHENYIQALARCGVDVITIPESEEFPDSTFVEDTAVLTPRFAVISNPGAGSRNGEITEMDSYIKEYYEDIYYIKAPGTLDGGDVLQIENHFYIGISERTNENGANQLKDILEVADYKVTIIPLKQFFHLKTGIAYLGNNQIVVAGEFIDHPDFKQYEQIIVPPEEEYCANCIRVNDYVIIPKGFEKTRENIQNAGYEIIELEMTEFQKQDGGLSCLSLRF